MTIEETVKSIRAEQRKRFGALGKKTDCVNHVYLGNVPMCKVCVSIFTNDSKQATLQCECDVCYFYKPKE